MLNPEQPSQALRWPRLGAVRERCKPLLRDGLAELFARVGATSPPRFARGALTVVTFHRVLPAERLREYPIPGLAVTPEQLEVILQQLAAHFSCMPLLHAFRIWQKGAGMDRPLLGITFDDGALDNYEYARPVLERLSLAASFYIPVGNVDERQAPWHDRLGFALLRSVAVVRKPAGAHLDRLLSPFGCSKAVFSALLPEDAVRLAADSVAAAKRLSSERRTVHLEALEQALGGDQVPPWAGLMSWDQIRQLAQAGHEIGSHSISHPLLTDCDAAQLETEISSSRTRLAAAIGGEVGSFCYPNGSYDARCLAAVRNAGYECAVTTAWGLNRPGAAPYELSRCDMDYARLLDRRGAFSAERLWLRLSGLQPGLRATEHRY